MLVKLSKDWSERESELLKQLTDICNVNHINVYIDHIPTTAFEGETVSLDVEHDESGEFVGCGILVSESDNVYYFSDLLLLRRLPFHTLAIVAHNGKSDLDLLRYWGINVADEQLVHDTMLMAHILDSSRRQYGLKKLSKEDLDINYPSYDDIVGKRSSHTRRTLDQWPVSIVSKYNALDVYCTDKLYRAQSRVLKPGSRLDQPYRSAELDYFNSLENPVSIVFREMEIRGVCVDLPYLEKLKVSLEDQRRPLIEAITAELGSINLNSPKQLLKALNAKGIEPMLKNKGSTDTRALKPLRHIPVVTALLKYSELDTLLSSFVYPYLERGQEIVHPQFNQCGTRTGRISCSNPNLLQIPGRTDNGKLVRHMFIPRPGMLMGDCDYGQIEPRVLAHLSKDPVLCDMFNKGVDFHAFTAERLGISRERAKVLNLSVGYRATFKSVMWQLGGAKDEAQTQINNWWNLFPTLRRWQDSLIWESRKSGICTTLLGRRIRVGDLSSSLSWKREAAERQLINNITQGSAAEIMKKAMNKISENIEIFTPGFGLLVQVYDELLFESPDAEADIEGVQEYMQYALKLDVPLTVDAHIGANWGDIH